MAVLSKHLIFLYDCVIDLVIPPFGPLVNNLQLGLPLPNSTLSRKTTKRSREICDGELKEMLANLFPHVRIHHILPRDRNSEVFDMALARNLFPFHPLSNFASQSSAGTKFAPWDPRTPPNVYTRPRLFVPYFEECKVSFRIDMVLSTLESFDFYYKSCKKPSFEIISTEHNPRTLCTRS